MKKIFCLVLICLICAGCSNKKAGEMSWTFQQTNLTDNILSISFADKNHGWAVTDNGKLLATEDGGKTWTSGEITDKKLTAVCAKSKKICWAAGEDGALFESMEGSGSMKDRSMESDIDFVDIAFWDKENGILIGNRIDRDSNVAGTVFRTSDGGQTWGEIYVAMDSVTCLFILGDVLGWVGTIGHIWTTSDNGANWDDNYLGSNISINDMFYDHYNSGWLVGDSGAYYTSSDGGWSWDPRGGQFPKRNLCDIAFIDRFGGFIVGQGGLVMVSQSGGEAWSFDDKITSKDLYDIAVDGGNVWICGADGTIIYVH